MFLFFNILLLLFLLNNLPHLKITKTQTKTKISQIYLSLMQLLLLLYNLSFLKSPYKSPLFFLVKKNKSLTPFSISVCLSTIYLKTPFQLKKRRLKRLYKFLNICYILNIKELILLLAYYEYLINKQSVSVKTKDCYFFM